MDTLLLSTAYFPPIQYFSKIRKNEKVYIEQYENFGKQSYRNRCEIMSANGVMPLTIPVVKANSKTLTRDLKIVYATKWQKLHFKGIESAYKSSPFYDYYIDDLMFCFERQEKYLLDLNTQILECILDMLKMKREIIFTEDYIKDTIGYLDLRDSIHPKASKKKEDPEFEIKLYRQTFSERYPFTPDLSILDLLFCTGPDSKEYL